MSLSVKILYAMLAGVLLGSLIQLAIGVELLSGVGRTVIQDWLVGGLLDFGGALFITSLKLMVVPVVLVSLVSGVCSVADGQTIGRLSAKALGLYIGTTAVAVTLALGLGLAIDPGEGVGLSSMSEFAVKEVPSIKQTLLNIVPTNPFGALAEGNMLQIIVFALLLGLSIRLAGDQGVRVAAVFQDWNAVVMRLVSMLIQLAPYGVFCLLCSLFAYKGIGVIGDLAQYFFLVLGVLVLHWVLTYGGLVALLARLSPWQFFTKLREPVMFAFSTASSAATIPVTLRTVRERLGVDNSVASFTVPLGATINMDGTAIMQGVATVFIAGAYGIDLTAMDGLMVVLTATLASIGTAGVPGVGLIMLTLVLSQVGLPIEGIGLIIGVDRLLDMVRTAVNVSGDAAVSCVVARSEDSLDIEVFDRAAQG